jgi:hypothetical protein
MPAKSKQQQKFMGLVRAVQKGDVSPSETSPEVRRAARQMKPKDVIAFASTKHKGLPNKKESIIREFIRKYVREYIREFEISKY